MGVRQAMALRNRARGYLMLKLTTMQRRYGDLSLRLDTTGQRRGAAEPCNDASEGTKGSRVPYTGSGPSTSKIGTKGSRKERRGTQWATEMPATSTTVLSQGCRSASGPAGQGRKSCVESQQNSFSEEGCCATTESHIGRACVHTCVCGQLHCAWSAWLQHTLSACSRFRSVVMCQSARLRRESAGRFARNVSP